MNHSITVPFYGSNLVSIKVEDVAYVAMRPIVEAIGLDWGSQSVKIRNNKEKLGCCDIATPSNGGMQSMVCIPIRKLNGWLFSINPAKVKESIRNKVIQYQEECFEALHDYWTKGIAVHPNFRTEKTRKALPNGLTVDQQDTIKTYHKTLVARLPKEKQAKLAITLWSAIKSKYGVSYKAVPPEEFTGVVSLMSRVAVDYLEAEWLPESKKVLINSQSEESLQNLKCLVSHMYWLRGWWEKFEPAVRGFNPRVAASVHDHFNDGWFAASSVAHQFRLSTPDKESIKLFTWGKELF